MHAQSSAQHPKSRSRNDADRLFAWQVRAPVLLQLAARDFQSTALERKWLTALSPFIALGDSAGPLHTARKDSMATSQDSKCSYHHEFCRSRCRTRRIGSLTFLEACSSRLNVGGLVTECCVSLQQETLLHTSSSHTVGGGSWMQGLKMQGHKSLKDIACQVDNNSKASRSRPKLYTDQEIRTRRQRLAT